MKGFKDSSNKFHPITDYKKGTRKSRDQKTKTIGVRLQRDERKGQISFNDSLKLGDVVQILGKMESSIDHSTPSGIKKANEIHDARMKIADVIMSNEVDSRLKREKLSKKFTGYCKKCHLFCSLDTEICRKCNEKNDLSKRKARDVTETEYNGFWTGLNAENRRALLGLYEPKWKSHASRDFKDLNPQEKNWVREQGDKYLLGRTDQPFTRKARDPDEGWQGRALSIPQLKVMLDTQNPELSSTNAERAIKQYYIGSATHVHARSSHPNYPNYCHHCGLNLGVN